MAVNEYFLRYFSGVFINDCEGVFIYNSEGFSIDDSEEICRRLVQPKTLVRFSIGDSEVIYRRLVQPKSLVPTRPFFQINLVFGAEARYAHNKW